MFARIHNNSDILENGQIMLLTDNPPGFYKLTDLQYLEHTLREVLVETNRSVQEAISNKDMFTSSEYVKFFASITANLKVVLDALLVVKLGIRTINEDGSMDQELLEKLKKYNGYFQV